jgi:hypothetical protein
MIICDQRQSPDEILHIERSSITPSLDLLSRLDVRFDLALLRGTLNHLSFALWRSLSKNGAPNPHFITTHSYGSFKVLAHAH